MKYLKRTWAEVSLDNLSHNYRTLREKLPSGCRFLGVVKADAYGHGAVPVSRHLCELGAEYLAVSNIEEAVQLRRGGLRGPILILGYTPPFYADELTAMNLIQEVHSLDYARALAERLSGLGRSLRVHIKLDTGMSRLGFFAYDHEQTLEELCCVARMPQLRIEGIFTHFPAADSLAPQDEAFTRLQFSRFMQMLSALKGAGIEPEIRHCCNSGATLLYPEYALDMIRPGLLTYGVAPAAELEGRLDLRAVMQLRSTVFQVREYDAGIGVSYGRCYTTPEPKRIAVVGIGYADGLTRALSGRMSVLYHGKRLAQVGRICMDMCMVDVTDAPQIRPGDTVTVFGEDAGARIGVGELTQSLGTIPYEMLCGINKRIPRIFLDGENQTEVLQYIV